MRIVVETGVSRNEIFIKNYIKSRIDEFILSIESVLEDIEIFVRNEDDDLKIAISCRHFHAPVFCNASGETLFSALTLALVELRELLFSSPHQDIIKMPTAENVLSS